jgi:hypothetical protein
MDYIPPLEPLKHGLDGQGGSVPLAQNIHAAVVDLDLGVTGSLTIKKPLPALLVNHLTTYQVTLHTHRQNQKLFALMHPDITLGIREPLAFEIVVPTQLA